MRLFLLLLAGITLVAPPAQACSYGPEGRLSLASNNPIAREKAEEQLREIFKKSDNIAKVRILKIYEEKLPPPVPSPKVAIVQVVENYKGNLQGVIEISYYAIITCGLFDLQPNERIIVSLYKNEEKLSLGSGEEFFFIQEEPHSKFLIKLSQESKTRQDNSGKNFDTFEENEFLTPMRPWSELVKPINEKEYIQKIKNIIGNCKSSKIANKNETNKDSRRFRYINIAYKDFVTLLVAGQEEKVISIFAPYYSREIDELSWKDKFVRPLVERPDGSTLILEGCDFPGHYTFFEPVSPPQ